MTPETRRRVLSALILLPVGVGLPWLPTPLFALLVVGVAGIGLWEWFRISRLPSGLPRISRRSWRTLGLCILSLAAFSLWQLHSTTGARGVMLLFVLVWVTDSAAYACGRRWGRHKLAPRISPGKTWEGLAGAVLVAAPVSTALFALWYGSGQTLLFIPVAIITILLAQAGDLMESKAKRIFAVKDSGTLIPGHGGVLDRVDGFLLAAPFLAVVLPYFEGITL
jgi:phosphatidate cytidylyltransferase